ncbi:hypothetical protein NQ166_06780 [Microbacterium sp. zg.Y1090]|uniref:hypothetical protein n=1 Tax=Microbacterium TaxID=33882 RepID=UPI00214B7422|nr:MULTISPECIES: hypothetical protein [unclassified Microbacterium]MCR2812018.1 hypothetical protein [Microbacterium sp. zg.Y1084]MCR2818543.1 hypothetical protein [Microbacterium sp. zg.Y1090]MDL5486356.1 hypothetical protein [Microbacterium sp. zg-Y1211]WIM29548.1 hypothetical protein QNO26_06590 [Microbacterium sp. zg-Y1090]
MRKQVASATAALVIAASPLMLGASAAPAADAPCVPRAAWTETVLVTPAVPAVAEIPGVPEVPEVSHLETRVIQEAWTETVVDKEAWTETVVDKEAWTETVVDKEAWTETVVDREAWDEEVFDHWQRYSWTGGPHLSDDPPAFPGADWQPNVKGDPHGVGHEGAYYRSHGGSGNGDWFYLEAVTTTVHHPAETHTVEHPAETHTVEHPAETHTVEHPAETHTVEHPAVTEEVTVVDQEFQPAVPGVPGTPAVPAVTREVHHPAVECAAPATLAYTGGSGTAVPVALAGAGALGLGLALVAGRRAARS